MLAIGVVVIAGSAVIFFLLSGGGSNKNAAKRAAAIGVDGSGAGVRASKSDPNKDRRRKVEAQLKVQEARAAAKKKVSLEEKIEQAGFDFEPKVYYFASLGAAVFGLLIGFLTGQNLVVLGLMILAFGVGLPKWFLGFMKKRRLKRFINDFSGAIDVIVRGIKTGLPVNDCMKLIAAETKPPVGEEFHLLTEGIRVGLTLEQSLNRMCVRVPLPEVQFFATVLLIQQKTGGNLGEALSNLSDVLRGRKSMEGKVKALSAEAKASAWILGSMPVAVGGLVNIMSPDYLTPLFTTTNGKMILLGCAVWMSIGTFIMSRMVKIKV